MNNEIIRDAIAKLKSQPDLTAQQLPFLPSQVAANFGYAPDWAGSVGTHNNGESILCVIDGHVWQARRKDRQLEACLSSDWFEFCKWYRSPNCDRGSMRVFHIDCESGS